MSLCKNQLINQTKQVPTGLPGTAPPGPAMPVTDTAISLWQVLRDPSAI
mgnify:CR=1 FL=1